MTMVAPDLVFQVVDWQQADVVPEGGGAPRLVVSAFGRTASGTATHLDITGFRPSFLVRIDKPSDASAAAREVRSASKEHSDARTRVGAMVERKDFMFYSTAKKRFLEVDFGSLRDYTSARGKLQRGRFQDAVYDAKLPPFLQLIHRTGVPSAGWLGVSLPEGHAGEGGTTVVDYRAISSADPPCAMAPLRVASFDIECWSSDGMFPVPVKGYGKLARDIVRHVAERSESEPRAWAIDALPELVAATFCPGGAGGLAKVTPMVPGPDACITATTYRTHLANDVADVLTSKQCASGMIAAVAAVLDAAVPEVLPRLAGDPVIQIGITINTVGEPGLERQVHVWGGCADIAGCVVHEYGSELDMLKGFAAAFRAADPDIVTGYNIVGFDFEYVYKRAAALARDAGTWLELGRISPERSKWAPLYVEKRLASSALGDNDLKYLDMPGRVIVDMMGVVKRDHKLSSYKLDAVAEHFLGERKHDVSPTQIFSLHLGGDADRAVIADYCVQDCALCNRLCERLSTLAGAFGMAEVCRVPATWIVTRGQGAKSLSLVADQCRVDGFAIPPLGGGEREKFDGALVLDPVTGIYLEDPVVVLDFASLYPSSMIANNMSHDTLLPPGDDGRSLKAAHGLETRRVDFLRYDPEDPADVGTPAHAEFVVTETPGILPRILNKLLSQRKATRARMRGLTDPFELGVLDGLQLAFKLSANSLYGQLGAATSPVRCTAIAASTTAVGRQMITKLQRFIEDDFGGRVVYGDTDSCFMTFEKLCVDAAGDKLRGRAAVAKCIELGQQCSRAFQAHLPPPQCAEYEKTLWPFILLSRKRYAANKYEASAEAEPSRIAMGIVMKRRDNAPIVKDVYGRCLDMILDEQDVQAAAESVQSAMHTLAGGDVHPDKLIVSKALRGDYVNPDSLPHAALAARMRARDEGSAPQVGDRVPYVFVRVAGKHVKQADRVEHPDYLESTGARIDYGFYITNQIMTPVVQVFALAVDKLQGCRLRDAELADPGKREREVQRILFDPALDRLRREAGGMRDIRAMFADFD
jgi:DNA polymerase elongation subunit (family B)